MEQEKLHAKKKVESGQPKSKESISRPVSKGEAKRRIVAAAEGAID